MGKRTAFRAVVTVLSLLAGGRWLADRWRTPDDLQDEVVLITGGSRGLGYLLAREFGRNGCSVAICARDAQELEQAREQLQQQGASEVFTVVCDVADPEQVRAMLAAVNAHYGQIDILVNNAGIIQVGPWESLTRQDFEDALNINFWAMVDCTTGVLPQMLERGAGRIVNITSIGGKVSVPHLLPYSSAKFAAVAFSAGLRAELAPKGIRVTTIVPGLMRTGSLFHALFKGQQDREFTWFSLSEALPPLSMNAERAARQIVDAVRRGQAERILTLPAELIARLYGLLPGITTNLISVTGSILLPDASGGRNDATRGITIYNRMDAPWLKALLFFNRRAAQRFNQFASLEEEVPDNEPGIEVEML